MATIDRRGVSVSATDTPIAGDPNPGLAIKAPCLVATAADIVLSGLQTIDGVSLSDGNRVLVWRQTDAKQNGLYNASSGNWTRTIDANGNDELAAGMQVVVSSGTTYARTTFVLATADPIVLDTSSISFVIAAVPSVRRIDTTAPLAGGGDLSANRTLSINANGITYALMQQAGASSILGNPTGAGANVSEIGLGATLAFAATLLTTVAMTGDVATAANSFATTIQPNVVSNAKFRQSAGLSVVGNTANATANVADIAGTADQVLRVNGAGTILGFGAIDLSKTAAATGVLQAASMPALTGDVTNSAGTVATTITANAVTYAKFQQVAASSLVGNATGSLANATGITIGATLGFSGSALQTQAGSGDVSWSANSFVTAIGANKVTNAMIRQGVARSVIGVTGNATANVADIQGTANQALVVNSAGTALAFGAVNLASTAAVTGTLASANGGTDNASYAVGDLLQASAVTPTLSRLAAVATGNALISGGVGVVSSWGKIGLTTHISGTLAAGNGGTGATSLGSELTVAANVLHVANNGITYALFQQVAASSLVGNATGSLATATGITLGATLAFSGSALQTAAQTGDVTTSANSFVTTIAANAVTNAKMATVATATFKGRTTAGTGNPEDLTATQATALLNAFVGDSGSGGTKGLVPAPGVGAATKFLRGDGTFASIPGGGDLLAANNLSDVSSALTARRNLPGIGFSANKAGTDQTGLPANNASYTKLTFTTEEFDIGSYYDAPNSKWTPPAGPVRLTVACYLTVNAVDQAQSLVSVYKNGSLFKHVAINNASGTNSTILSGTAIDNANGTDYYEAFFNKGGAGNGTVSGSTAYTYFQGEML